MQLKLSRYIVTSDSFIDGLDNKEKVVGFSTRSQNAFIFEKEKYDLLQSGKFDLLPFDFIMDMMSSEILIPASEDELKTILSRSASAINDNKSLYYVIQPSAQCQLGCGYCGQTHRNVKLNGNLQKEIINRIETKLKTREYNDLSIGWFGGEPLSAFSSMVQLSEDLINLAKKHKCTYSAKIVTNGLSLNPMKFHTIANDLKISDIEITLDGSAQYHDVRRHTKNGSPTFNRIFNNLVYAANSKENLDGLVNITVRCNVDRRNAEGVPELLNQLKESDLQNKINFYCAPIHSWGNDAHNLSFSPNEFADLEIEWLMQMKELGFRVNLFPGAKPIVCMTVHKDAEVIDAYGNIFSCTEIPYVDSYNASEYVLGNILNKNDTNKNRTYDHFFTDILEDKFDCNKCPMLPVCGGACPKQWYEGNIPCPPNKFNLGKKLLLHQLIIRKEAISKYQQHEL